MSASLSNSISTLETPAALVELIFFTPSVSLISFSILSVINESTSSGVDH